MRYGLGRGPAANDSNGNAKDMYDSHHDKQVDDRDSDEEDKSSSAGSAGGEGEESKPQSGYFHVVASFILIIHGFTFLVPPDSEAEDTDMMRTIGKWLGFEWDWMRHFTPYAQGLASVFNISLGIVSWWTSKESDSYNRLIQLRVFAFCVNILHAYITGPILYQNDESPVLATGRIIGLFRLSYLTPGLMAAGVTEVIIEKEQEQSNSTSGAVASKKAGATTAGEKEDSSNGAKKNTSQAGAKSTKKQDPTQGNSHRKGKDNSESSKKK